MGYCRTVGQALSESGHPAAGANGAIDNWGAGRAGGWLWTTTDLKAVDPNYDGCGYVDNILIKCAGLPDGLTDAEKTQRTGLTAFVRAVKR